MMKRILSLLVLSLLLAQAAHALPSFEEVRKSYTLSESFYWIDMGSSSKN